MAFFKLKAVLTDKGPRRNEPSAHSETLSALPSHSLLPTNAGTISPPLNMNPMKMFVLQAPFRRAPTGQAFG